jgi:peptide/nickel transport system permease protein
VHCGFPCFGYSYRQNDTVGHLIWQALPVSLSLCIGAAVLWLLFGVTVGTVSALKPRSIGDRVGMVTSLAGVSLPIFFTGPLLLLFFEYKLGWINPTYAPLTQDPGQWFEGLILPWVSLAFLYAAIYARMTRSNMMETLGEDFMRTARAKGLKRRVVIGKHGLRSALTPVVTIFAIDFAQLIGTTVITETVFNLRGIGFLALQAVHTQDLPVILGVTVVAAFVLVVANALVDIVYAFIDPRVRL